MTGHRIHPPDAPQASQRLGRPGRASAARVRRDGYELLVDRYVSTWLLPSPVAERSFDEAGRLDCNVAVDEVLSRFSADAERDNLGEVKSTITSVVLSMWLTLHT